jgi:hypothetical protein
MLCTVYLVRKDERTMRKGSRGKAKEDHCVQSVRVCISVAVDYLREAEWKVLLFGLWAFVGFGAGRGRGAGDHSSGRSRCYQSGNPLPANQPLPLRSAKILPRRHPWFAALGCQFFWIPL